MKIRYRLRSFLFLTASLCLINGLPFQTRAAESPKPATAFQLSTLPALSLGLYDGTMTVWQVLKHGDFGLGTVDALDGELIILGGQAYQVRSDGSVAQVANKTTTPFAVVTHFTSPQVYQFQDIDYAELKKRLSSLMPTANVPYAIQVQGTFAAIKTRSVARQSKPYRPLGEVTKTQSVFQWQDATGTLVGFRFPAYLSDVNLADFHFHFLRDDKKGGGHLLDCKLRNVQVTVQEIRNFQLALPGGDFDSANLSTDQSADLKQAETGK